jgi:hypothetical protein
MEDFFYAGACRACSGSCCLCCTAAGPVNGRSLADSDDPSMAIDESSVLVLEHAGPRGAAAAPRPPRRRRRPLAHLRAPRNTRLRRGRRASAGPIRGPISIKAPGTGPRARGAHAARGCAGRPPRRAARAGGRERAPDEAVRLRSCRAPPSPPHAAADRPCRRRVRHPRWLAVPPARDRSALPGRRPRPRRRGLLPGERYPARCPHGDQGPAPALHTFGRFRP